VAEKFVSWSKLPVISAHKCLNTTLADTWVLCLRIMCPLVRVLLGEAF